MKEAGGKITNVEIRMSKGREEKRGPQIDAKKEGSKGNREWTRIEKKIKGAVGI